MPHIARQPLEKDQYPPLMERVKKQFPNVGYDVTGKPSLRVFTNNGEEFNSWLNAIGYVDSMVAGIHWNLIFFCVGPECPRESMIQAEMVAETMSILPPDGIGTAPPAAGAPAK